MSSVQLYPQVFDGTNIAAKYSLPYYLPIAVEGQGSTTGSALAGSVKRIDSAADADANFGAGSSLADFCRLILGRNVAPIKAVASVMGATTPTLAQRQAAWANLESDPTIRLRMSDSVAQADLVALADSCENADLAGNKQVGFGGLAAGTAKAALISAATAIASKRFVLVGPGIIDSNGVTQSGNYAAAIVGAAVARNPNIADDLDLLQLGNVVGIENDALGNPLFNKRVVSGALVNDFEDLLQGGVSPIQNDPTTGTATITHLRTTWKTDNTFDSLMTRLIVDQLFLDVQSYILNGGFLRRGNTVTTRTEIRAGVEGLLTDRAAWLTPNTQADGSTNYGVMVAASTDNRQVIVSYEGTIVRGIQSVVVEARLTIPV